MWGSSPFGHDCLIVYREPGGKDVRRSEVVFGVVVELAYTKVLKTFVREELWVRIPPALLK